MATITLIGTSSSNYINQITAGELTYDVAVSRGITFYDGTSDASGTEWDGTQAISVVIPTISDLISSPVVFAGTVDSEGSITYTGSFGPDPAKGYLVYILDDCTFGGKACEAGDMAVYDGTAWRVVSGENQVTISTTGASVVGNDTTHLIGGNAKTLLDVEGKTLSVALDYADILAKTTVDKNTATEYNVTGGKVSVAPMYIGLTQTAGSTKDISQEFTFDLPNALASGAVTISDKVLVSGDFTFAQGSFPTISKNAAAISISASTGISIGKATETDGTTGDYITSISAIKGISFTAGTDSSNHLAYVASLSAITGTDFVTGVHAWTNADGENAPDFVIPGAITADAAANTFVAGLTAASDSGDVVSSITVGTVSVNTSGTDFLAGLSKGGNAVVTSVSIGTAIKDTTEQWFYDGLTDGSDVVTNVEVGTVSLVADNQGGAAAMVSASVSNHVLSFSTANFQTPVTISQGNSTISKKAFTKGGVSLSGFGSESDVFTKAGITQAATTISYKSINTAQVSLTQDAATKYYLDLSADHAYEAVMGYKLISMTDATFTKNSPVLTNTDVTVTIPADTVAVDVTGGTLPTLSISAPTGVLTGEVGTALASTSYTVLGVSASEKEIAIAGAYTLGAVASDAANAVAVASSGEYSVNTAKVTIAADTFVTDVYVNGSAASPRVSA